MDGVVFEQDQHTLSTICVVETLTDELKGLIRNNLSSICQGVSRGESREPVYSYLRTLKEFLARYTAKPVNIQKGIIGELLAHILFIEHFQDFRTVSPLFNLEDRNIKKAFDVILFHSTSQQLYFTEVKSGTTRGMHSNDCNKALLDTAKRDIHEKLSNSSNNSWLNAINGATISLEKENIKDEVVNTLQACLSDSQEGSLESKTKNIILVSVTYNALSDRIELSGIVRYFNDLDASRLFNASVVFSIQKETHESIEVFLKSEAGSD